MYGNRPRVGTTYIKIIETGQIVKWKSFDEKTQEYEVVSPGGKLSKIAGRKISKQVTPEEEAEFLRLQNKKSN